MRNPYIVDRPLDGQDLFFGREQAISFFEQAWQGEQRLFLLYGNRRIGKTSLVNQLQFRLIAYDLRSVDWDEIPENVEYPLDRVMWAVARARDWPAPERPRANQGTAYYAEYLGQQAQRGMDTEPVVVCIDGIPAQVCAADESWPELLQNLKHILEGGPVIVLLTIEGRPEECVTAGEDLRPVVLGGLSHEETEEVLLLPARGQLTYDLASMRRIYALTGGEPYLVQLFGHTLYEQRARRGWVSLTEIDGAIGPVIEQAAPLFVEMWNRCTVPAHIVMCVFAKGIGTHGIGSADDIRRRLARLRVDMPLDDIQAALTELTQRDVVERLGGGLYRFRNALYLRWLRENKDAVQIVRSSREYRRAPRPRVSPWMNRRFDWLGLGLWVVIGLLIVAIGSVWRGRETQIIWTDRPPTATVELAESEPVIVPTPEREIISGRIAYMAKAEAGHYWDIYVMGADGLDPQRLTETESDDGFPNWSPDGRRIAFVSDRDGNREIYVMNADGTAPTNLTNHPAEDWTPSWSPDGSRIVFSSFRDGNWEIYVMQADGSNQRRLTQNPAADYSPAWSPDGESIAFVSDRSGDLDIYLMRPDGSDVRQFTTDPATDQAPTWSPDGRQLLWESYRHGNMEIFVGDIDGGEPRNLTQDAYADDHGGTWCPSGRRIAYFSNRQGGWDIYTLDLQTGERTNITQSSWIEQYPSFGP